MIVRACAARRSAEHLFPRAELCRAADELAAAGGGADETGVAAELSVADLCLRRRYRKGQLADVMTDALQEGVSGRDHAAAENDHVRINGVHQVHGPDGQVER